ncbi:MAG: MoaD/ThiS family protein [Thaumarchaeota archaeon]|jgi:molybdopterin converting factor small subunit|nr:MoaD/ThiS family protein [Candidatus Geocrenenecus arthurdayi]MCL7388463.1 MoaD/ThiS family protein [Candidatus Geocrenenecus arthurdayi]MCL7390836.1 MoaD/ThiS family protein [Candidatus Geocrenenecus arthurdayi]MCL7396198.1 MoaD/ThiS family protein [Candidatus Geocrenenecus arthurdayi]MCL7403081.1 MoaD/ThiS family protein [Candidatus Geocrenenecus arthurdayi]
MKIEFIGPLKKAAGVSELELKIDGEKKLLEVLEMLPESIKKRILESSGKISPDIMILVNGVEVKSLGLENMHVKESDRIVLIPVIHGGCV